MPDVPACLDFLQRLIQTPGLPGEEGVTASLVQHEMEVLGYDDVHVDAVGNVIGVVRGRGEAPDVMFNTHLDHVSVGDPNDWPHPPFDGVRHADAIWGRGAVDIKGPLAAQVYGVAALVGDPPPGDVYVTAVVQEEVGGVGARYLMKTMRPPLVIVGEPSQCEVRRGHRGRWEFELHVRGRSVHASAPERGANALAVVARFIQGLDTLDMASAQDFGRSTVVPTLLRTDQTSANVVPGEAWLTCDWRCVPGEDVEDARVRLEHLARASLVPGTSAEVTLPVYPRVTYTGMSYPIPGDNPPYSVSANSPAVRAALDVLAEAHGTMPPVGLWKFASDGGHFAAVGLTCVGYGPGDEALAHTSDEHVPISQIALALAGNTALARDWPTRACALGFRTDRCTASDQRPI